GQYKFVPANRTYPTIASNQPGQDYSMYVVGDAAPRFRNRPAGGVSPDAAAGNDAGVQTVGTVALPTVRADQSRAEFTAPVTTTAVDAQTNIVGFQGDIQFDERELSFASEPIRKAGLTSGNWNVAGNVLPGAGPIRTLRVSGFSHDFAPLSGQGRLFELNVSHAGSLGTDLTWLAAPNNFLFIDAD